jgi:DNA repair protein RadA/Sms
MFVCHECGAGAPRWQGRCPGCGAWGTLDPPKGDARSPPRLQPLAEVATTPLARFGSGYAELDRVLGGGLVPGTTTLIGGEPGIGKSTLLLAAAARVEGKALYVAGEESPRQVALRARRLGIHEAGVLVFDGTDTAAIARALEHEAAAVCVIDSVQTLRSDGVDGVPGGPAQVRAAAERLVPVARATGTALIFVGQVTKVGGLAGPRFLEHAVDAVVLFEGDRQLSVRALRVVKNRFGPADEIGLFEMREDGLHEVRNASHLLLADRAFAGPGSVVACVVEGRRALCVEVQALLVGKDRPVVKRRAQGLDARRAELLVGVVESLYCGPVSGRDVFVNVVGGLTVHDTGLDLAVAAAVLSAQFGIALDPRAVLMGEIGLRGEVRAVPRLPQRLKEARAMGFKTAFVPRGTPPLDGIELIEVARTDAVLPPPPQRQPAARIPRLEPEPP